MLKVTAEARKSDSSFAAQRRITIQFMLDKIGTNKKEITFSPLVVLIKHVFTVFPQMEMSTIDLIQFSLV